MTESYNLYNYWALIRFTRQSQNISIFLTYLEKNF